jgi:hypothetical protein
VSFFLVMCVKRNFFWKHHPWELWKMFNVWKWSHFNVCWNKIFSMLRNFNDAQERSSLSCWHSKKIYHKTFLCRRVGKERSFFESSFILFVMRVRERIKYSVIFHIFTLSIHSDFKSTPRGLSLSFIIFNIRQDESHQGGWKTI